MLDNSPANQHSRIDDIEVLSPEEGIKLSFDAIVIMSFYVKEMRRQLTDLGVPENSIFHFYNLHGLVYRKEHSTLVAGYDVGWPGNSTLSCG